MTAAFDAGAAGYDAQELNPIVALLRSRSLLALMAAFPPASRLLDVGAGTGTEAMALAAAGRTVVACDPSPAMLARLTSKAARRGLVIPAHPLAARDLPALGEPGGAFDGAYSSFGALNAEPDLAPVAAALGHLVRPGGAVILGLMSRWALPEIAGLVLAGRPRAAFRRTSGWARVGVEGSTLSVHYHVVGEVRAAITPWFDLVSVRSLGLLTPPPAAWPRVRALRPLLPLLDRVDAAVSGLPGLCRLGDHVVISLRRRG